MRQHGSLLLFLALGLGLAAGPFFFVTSGDFFLAGVSFFLLTGGLDDLLVPLPDFGGGLLPVARFCQNVRTSAEAERHCEHAVQGNVRWCMLKGEDRVGESMWEMP